MRTSSRWLFAGLSLLVATTSGCCFGRPDVKELADEQQAYYTDLGKTLEAHRELFRAGLRFQLRTDMMRRQEILTWERDLEKASVLLATPGKPQEKKKMALLKMAELDLARRAQVDELLNINQDRIKAVVELYDAVIKATKALKGNNKALIDYSGDGNWEFALKSLDTAAIAFAVAETRAAQDRLKGVEAKSEEERKKESERLLRNMDRARETLLKAF